MSCDCSRATAIARQRNPRSTVVEEVEEVVRGDAFDFDSAFACAPHSLPLKVGRSLCSVYIFG